MREKDKQKEKEGRPFLNCISLSCGSSLVHEEDFLDFKLLHADVRARTSIHYKVEIEREPNHDKKSFRTMIYQLEEKRGRKNQILVSLLHLISEVAAQAEESTQCTFLDN